MGHKLNDMFIKIFFLPAAHQVRDSILYLYGKGYRTNRYKSCRGDESMRKYINLVLIKAGVLLPGFWICLIIF